jgi:hypothetical protein
LRRAAAFFLGDGGGLRGPDFFAAGRGLPLLDLVLAAGRFEPDFRAAMRPPKSDRQVYRPRRDRQGARGWPSRGRPMRARPILGQAPRTG